MSRNTPFSALLRQSLPAGTSGREFGRKAGLGESTGTAYLNGRHGTVSTDSMEKIHEAYPTITVAAMRQALGLPAEARRWTPPDEANLLDPEVQDAISVLIKALVKSGGGRDVAQGPAPNTQAGGDTPTAAGAPDELGKRRRLSDAESRRLADEEVERRRQRADSWRDQYEAGQLAARTEKTAPEGARRRRAQDEAAERGVNDDEMGE